MNSENYVTRRQSLKVLSPHFLSLLNFVIARPFLWIDFDVKDVEDESDSNGMAYQSYSSLCFFLSEQRILISDVMYCANV